MDNLMKAIYDFLKENFKHRERLTDLQKDIVDIFDELLKEKCDYSSAKTRIDIIFSKYPNVLSATNVLLGIVYNPCYPYTVGDIYKLLHTQLLLLTALGTK